MWTTCEQYVTNMWTTCGQHVNMWTICGQYVTNVSNMNMWQMWQTWTTCDKHENMWTTCGQRDKHVNLSFNNTLGEKHWRGKISHLVPDFRVISSSHYETQTLLLVPLILSVILVLRLLLSDLMLLLLNKVTLQFWPCALTVVVVKCGVVVVVWCCRLCRVIVIVGSWLFFMASCISCGAKQSRISNNTFNSF